MINLEAKEERELAAIEAMRRFSLSVLIDDGKWYTHSDEDKYSDILFASGVRKLTFPDPVDAILAAKEVLER